MSNIYKQINETEEREFMSTGEVAKIFGVTVATVRRWDKNGKLKSDLKVSSRGDRRYLVKTVKKYFAKLAQ